MAEEKSVEEQLKPVGGWRKRLTQATGVMMAFASVASIGMGAYGLTAGRGKLSDDLGAKNVMALSSALIAFGATGGASAKAFLDVAGASGRAEKFAELYDKVQDANKTGNQRS